MSILAIDFGTKRVGLAVSDAARQWVFPRETLERSTPEAEAEVLRHRCREDGIGLVVVGLPVNVDGSEGPMAKAARDYGTWVASAVGLPVRFVDERYSSQEAEEHLRERFPKDTRRRRRLRDRTAAVIILRTYLDHGDAEPGPPSD